MALVFTNSNPARLASVGWVHSLTYTCLLIELCANGNCAILFSQFRDVLRRCGPWPWNIPKRQSLRTRHRDCPTHPASRAGTKSSRLCPVMGPHTLQYHSFHLPPLWKDPGYSNSCQTVSTEWVGDCTCGGGSMKPKESKSLISAEPKHEEPHHLMPGPPEDNCHWRVSQVEKMDGFWFVSYCFEIVSSWT